MLSEVVMFKRGDRVMSGGLFGKILDTVVDIAVDTVVDIVTDPIKPLEKAVKLVEDGIAIVDGLTEGELRAEAAARLGVSVTTGMDLDELVEWYQRYQSLKK